MNKSNPGIKRIMADVRELERHPSYRYSARPLEDNMFEWHFTIRGPVGSDFEGGVYHGRILLPPEYPFKPPNIVFLNQNGRFEVGTKICLSISAYHEESWQPAWGIRTMLEAIISFLPSEGGGAIGALDWTKEERQRLAKLSQSWVCNTCECAVCELVAKPTAEEEAAEKAGQVKPAAGGDGMDDAISQLSFGRETAASGGGAGAAGGAGGGGGAGGATAGAEGVTKPPAADDASSQQQEGMGHVDKVRAPSGVGTEEEEEEEGGRKEEREEETSMRTADSTEGDGIVSPPSSQASAPLTLDLPARTSYSGSNNGGSGNDSSVSSSPAGISSGSGSLLSPTAATTAANIQQTPVNQHQEGEEAPPVPPPAWQVETPPSVIAVRRRILASRAEARARAAESSGGGTSIATADAAEPESASVTAVGTTDDSSAGASAGGVSSTTDSSTTRGEASSVPVAVPARDPPVPLTPLRVQAVNIQADEGADLAVPSGVNAPAHVSPNRPMRMGATELEELANRAGNQRQRLTSIDAARYVNEKVDSVTRSLDLIIMCLLVVLFLVITVQIVKVVDGRVMEEFEHRNGAN